MWSDEVRLALQHSEHFWLLLTERALDRSVYVHHDPTERVRVTGGVSGSWLKGIPFIGATGRRKLTTRNATHLLITIKARVLIGHIN